MFASSYNFVRELRPGRAAGRLSWPVWLLLRSASGAPNTAPTGPKASAAAENGGRGRKSTCPTRRRERKRRRRSTLEEEGEEQSATPRASGDLGAPPPKRADPGAGQRARTSPLTPDPNEFPEGGRCQRRPTTTAARRHRRAAQSRRRADHYAVREQARVVVSRRDGCGAHLGVQCHARRRRGVRGARAFQRERGRRLRHAVAPGHHVLGLEIERYDARNRDTGPGRARSFRLWFPRVSWWRRSRDGRRFEHGGRLPGRSGRGIRAPGTIAGAGHRLTARGGFGR